MNRPDPAEDRPHQAEGWLQAAKAVANMLYRFAKAIEIFIRIYDEIISGRTVRDQSVL